MMADPDFPAPQGALPVWIKVFTKPSEQTFIEITSHPDAKARAAYIWVFLAGTLSGLLNSLTQFAVSFAGLQQAAPEFGQVPGSSTAVGIGGLLFAVCFAPLTGLFSVVGFSFGVAIIHATAKFFGGQGLFDKMAYAVGAITVPITIISALTVPLNVVPFLSLCTLPVLILLGLYALYLEVAAIKAVHRLGWGESAAALFLPTILLALIFGVIILGLVRLAGPEFNEIFRQLQQGAP
jgi:hypothetical protein